MASISPPLCRKSYGRLLRRLAWGLDSFNLFKMVGPTGLTLSKSGTLIGQHLTKQKKQLSEWYDAVEIFSYEPNADASAGDPYEDDEDESGSLLTLLLLIAGDWWLAIVDCQFQSGVSSTFSLIENWSGWFFLPCAVSGRLRALPSIPLAWYQWQRVRKSRILMIWDQSLRRRRARPLFPLLSTRMLSNRTFPP